MIRQCLNGTWELRLGERTPLEGHIPGSVYSILLENEAMEDPFWRDNELKALALMEENSLFTRQFRAEEALFDADRILLRCEGLDTLCELRLNGKIIGRADNFHRTWEFDVTDALRHGENLLEIAIASPTRAIRAMDDKRHVGCSIQAMRGCSHLRKPHCMFGWDWGPRLPDMGIWRDIELLGVTGSRLENVVIRQQHQNGQVWLTVNVQQTGSAAVEITLTAPDGQKTALTPGQPNLVDHPKLWWPRGYGEQPLYTVDAVLLDGDIVLDSVTKRIGLRTMTIAREQDEWGESFAHEVNGLRIFAMGADYIPQDNIYARMTPERTRKLLEQCVQANFNCIRVWGGGNYPSDDFFDACDELGLLVWQDMMFACANYPLDDEFEASITAEITDNVRRIRHHACLALWCGNNEIEGSERNGAYDSDNRTRADYIRIFEHIIPHILKREDPDTFYWPSSPSSGGSFDDPDAENRGDVHDWSVWHGGLPFAAYRKRFHRYVSEFGFQSFPNMRTIESFTLPEDRNIFSRVMEMHQRNEGANGKIMQYLSQTYLYPHSFELLVYASQLLQAEAVRYGVEHWRRQRGRCMGTIYWQLNDIWPVASWASIDYYGRWKALHYIAKRFFAPVMISCEEIGETTHRIAVVSEPSPIETSIRLNVANETLEAVAGTVTWALRDADGQILERGETPLTVPALSAVWCERHVFEALDFLERYVSYAFVRDGAVISEGSCLFTAPKHFHFRNPRLTLRREGNELVVTADAYARGVALTSPDSDFLLSDNYFDLNGGEKRLRILEGNPETLIVRSVYDIQ